MQHDLLGVSSRYGYYRFIRNQALYWTLLCLEISWVIVLYIRLHFWAKMCRVLTSPAAKTTTLARRRHHHSSPSSSVNVSANPDHINHTRRSISRPPSYSIFSIVFPAVAILSSCVQVTSAFQRPQSSGINSAIRHGPAHAQNNVHGHNQNQRRHASASPTLLHAVNKRQVSVVDGAELYSVESFLAEENGSNEKPPRSGMTRLGFLTVVAGTVEGEDDSKYSGKRVVGVEIAGSISDDASDGEKQSSAVSLGDGASLHKESVAIIPDAISDTDAIATMMASLSAVHCALPKSENVGGSADSNIISGKAVVVGGGEYATFAADALATLGADVFQISTGKPNPKNRNVKVLPPCIGPDDTGFSEYIDTFDCLVDTLAEEPPSVITELSRQHNCERYVSTYSKSQQIIRDKGILFGRDVAKQYVVDAATNSLLSGNTNSANVNLLPPKGFGAQTVQKLLDAGIVYRPRDQKMTNKDVFVREWSLKDFWEFTSWPRDADGEGNTRYGLPVLDTEDFDLVYAMSLAEDEANAMAEEGNGSEDEESAPSLRRVAPSQLSRGAADNPYVLDVNGVEGLNRQIVGPRKHAVVFCSASWCRTCRSLKPKYTKIARESGDDNADDGGEEITFAEADTTGTQGKILSRYLDVEAVPAFVLFKSGKIYGEPLSISRLPSKKLNLAVELLRSGKEYDAEAINALER